MTRNTSWRLLVSSLLGSASLLPTACFAQQARSAPSPSNTASSAASRDDDAEIIVTARHSAENQQQVPIAITTVTAQKLQDLHIEDIVDLQRVSPGLLIAVGTGRPRMTIRGQTEVEGGLTGARAVGVYIDGVSIDTTYGLTQALVDIAQVEVLKGPQGTLFGKNTTGGAINITTQHPTNEWGGYAELEYGSYNNAQASLVINAPLIDDKLAARFVGQVVSRAGYYREFDGHESEGEQSRYARLLVKAQPSENVELLLSGDYAQSHDSDQHFAITDDSMLASQNTATGYLGAIAKELGLNPSSTADRLAAYNAYRVYATASLANPRLGFSDFPGDYGAHLETFSLSGNLKAHLGHILFTSITSYRHLDHSLNSDADNTPFDLFAQRQRRSDSNFTQEFQLSSIDSHGFDWQVGAYYNRERGNEYSAQDTADYVNPNRALITESGIRKGSRAVYGQGVYNFSSQFRVTAGIRYTRDSQTYISKDRTDLTAALPPLPAGGVSRCNLLLPALGGPTYPDCRFQVSTSSEKVTWLASADWRPIKNLMLYGLVTTGYRAGGFSPRGGSTPITSVAANNAAFTPYLPESLINYEVGIKSDFLENRLRINVSGFYQKYDDVQVRIRDIVNGVLVRIVRNAAKATIYGGELEVTARPVDGLTINGNASYLHARYDQYFARDSSGVLLDLSSQPFSAPTWTWSIGASYQRPVSFGSLRFALNYSYKGNVNYAPGTLPAASVSQNGFGVLDGRIGLHLEGPDVDVAIFGKNLTNKTYRSLAFTIGGENVASLGAPRTLGVELKKTF